MKKNNDLLITIDIDKEPYIKTITKDKIINITGESGSGKSTFCNQWKNDSNYIVIDTDIIFGNIPISNAIETNLKNIFIQKYGFINKSLLIEKFDECYEIILDFFKDYPQTIVIDSAQYRNMKDLSKLKGKIIIIRTCINTCYQRCLDRYNSKKTNATIKEKENYSKRKKEMFNWYKNLNEFILKISKQF